MVFVAEDAARRDVGALIVEATHAIVDDPEMSADSARWFRTGRREVEARRDGVTLDAAGLSPGMTALAKLLPDMSAKTSDAYWLAMTRDVQVPTAPVLGIVFVRDRLDMAHAIAAGRAWQRLHLAATAAGLVAQPLNQPVERADRDEELGRPDHFGAALAQFARSPPGRPPSSSASASPSGLLSPARVGRSRRWCGSGGLRPCSASGCRRRIGINLAWSSCDGSGRRFRRFLMQPGRPFGSWVWGIREESSVP